MTNSLQRALLRITSAEQRKRDVYPYYCSTAHLIDHLQDLANSRGDLAGDAAEELIREFINGTKHWQYRNGCVWCGTELPPPASDPAHFPLFTLADQAACDTYLGFGSVAVYAPKGQRYAVIGMLAEHAGWQRLRLQSGLQGGSEVWSSFAAAKQACDTLNAMLTR